MHKSLQKNDVEESYETVLEQPKNEHPKTIQDFDNRYMRNIKWEREKFADSSCRGKTLFVLMKFWKFLFYTRMVLCLIIVNLITATTFFLEFKKTSDEDISLNYSVSVGFTAGMLLYLFWVIIYYITSEVDHVSNKIITFEYHKLNIVGYFATFTLFIVLIVDFSIIQKKCLDTDTTCDIKGILRNSTIGLNLN